MPDTLRAEGAPQAAAPAGASLLMHMCCGPCACICIQRLQAEGWNITGYYMNPNIQPLAEYLRRREAAGQCAEHFGIPMVYGDEAWDLTAWLRQVQGRDTPPERILEDSAIVAEMIAAERQRDELRCELGLRIGLHEIGNARLASARNGIPNATDAPAGKIERMLQITESGSARHIAVDCEPS